MKTKLISRILMILLLFSACSQVPAQGTGTTSVTAPPSQIAQIAPVETERPKVYLDAKSFQQVFNDVAKKVLPTVVEIDVVDVVKQKVPMFNFNSPWEFFFNGPEYQEKEFKRSGLGSGVIARREGDKIYILTNAHVVSNADEITVKLEDQRTFTGKLVGKDERIDLAVLEIKTKEKLPIAELGDSDSLEVGDWVLAIGNPYGFSSTVTAGIISALGRKTPAGAQLGEFTDYIQTDAAINPGNSGGALVNLDGQVIGINSWIASQNGGNVGLGFAIPINTAKRAMEQIISKGKVSYGWLGVTIADITEEAYPGLKKELGLDNKKGTLVTNIYTDSPAWQAGIRPGDYIIQVDDTKIENANQLSREIGMHGAGSKIAITLIRLGEEKTITLKLAERKEEQELTEKTTNIWPGITAVDLTKEIRERYDIKETSGVLVIQAINNTAPQIAGIRAGDIIKAIGNSEIKSMKDFYAAIAEQSKKGSTIRFSVSRQGTQVLIGVKIP
ncbi:Do family serine endopeptidase [Spirochaetia bacterium 38H-sp]|uniref:Do family serine endopeptidase n=1 Tax=Rarispira pelagica TaxID=3141764 RepID=A0ABU9UCD8_9SPIR